MDIFLQGSAKRPRIIGTGFITLDIVLNRRVAMPPQIYAGGTCGNVIAILGYLGWDSYPMARLNDDSAAQNVIADLKKGNVKLDFIQLQPNADTPIIVQEIKQNSRGENYHKFSWTCPQCGAWLPPYKAVLVNTVKDIIGNLPTPQVFFFDRVSRGALILAEKYALEGAIVFFEPSGIGDIKLFKEALQLSHVVKYAEDRAPSFRELISLSKPPVEIETLGKRGLRYRTSLKFMTQREWNAMSAFKTNIIDTAGAGDWCTAGIIHSLGKFGFSGLKDISSERFVEALNIGQVMASWTCRFEGARGGMYQTKKNDFKDFVESTLMHNKLFKEKLSSNSKSRSKQDFACPSCSNTSISKMTL